jgi:hypothetical protein
MATDPVFDEVNVTTLREIYPRAIEDEFFLDTPLLSYLRANCMVPFPGGTEMSNGFLYAPLIGGFYPPGGNFNITKRQTLSAMRFDPKYAYVSVVEYLEDILVRNKGPQAVFSLIDIDLRNAMNTISAIIAVAMALHGQAAGTNIVGNRPNSINGWEEAFDDGTHPQWDGSVFTAYGTQARNGAVKSALNSQVYWGGTQTGGLGPITYQVMEETYQTCSIGREEPDLGTCNKALYAYIKERIQPQQRFAQERDPFFGVAGMKMNNAMILKDDYFPSLKYGQNDPDLGNWLTGSITNPLPSGSSTAAPDNNNFPNSTQAPTLTVGEVFNWFNTKKLLFRVTDDAEFGFGWTGFVRAQDNTRVVGQVKAMVNLECTAPRLGLTMYGFGG